MQRITTLNGRQFLTLLTVLLPCFVLAQNAQPTNKTDAKLDTIEAKIDKLQAQKSWRSPELLLPAIAALAGAAGGWLTGFLTKRLELREGEAAQVSNEVVQSLKWFEGGSQVRSIGIAYIETRFTDHRYRQFHTIWGSVLANQAIYLLTGSEHASFHEQDNLERVLNLLLQLPKIDGYASVKRAYEWKRANPNGKGVALTNRVEGLVKRLPAI